MYESGGKVCVIGGLVVWFEVDSLKGIAVVKSTFVYNWVNSSVLKIIDFIVRMIILVFSTKNYYLDRT